MMNWNPNWIEKVWKDNPMLIAHFNEKFEGLNRRHDPATAIVRFFFELSEDNQELLINWVTNCYDWTEIQDGDLDQ